MNVKKIEMKDKTIKRLMHENESLKKENEVLKSEIQDLLFEQEKNLNTIMEITSLRDSLEDTLSDLGKKEKEYDKLINELKSMKKALNKEVFKGKWCLVKLLLK